MYANGNAMLWPNGTTTRPRVSSPFGARTSPTAGASSNHRGTDFTGFSTVRAVTDGTVAAVGTPVGWSGGGTQVWVWHDGFLTRSLHMVKGSPVVKVGQQVSAGDPLGVMGMTGTATGVHLHLEVVVGGVQVDPVPFISNRIAAPSGDGSTSGDDDMPYSPEEIKALVKAALIETVGNDGRNVLDGVIQTRSDVDAVQDGVNDAGGKVWRNPLTNPLTGESKPAKEFVRYLPHYHRDIILEVRALNVSNLAKFSDAQLAAYADAVAVELAKRKS